MIKEQPDQVKDVIIKIKSLQQKIKPVNIGVGGTRPYIYILFDKEAAAQFTKSTLVYLSWIHINGKRIKGYNVFKQISNKPNVWYIHLPQSMLGQEGVVQARIELVDSRSIAPSTNFEINILHNPNEEETFSSSDDYTVFQEAIVELTDKINQTKEILENTQETVKDLNNLFTQVQEFYHIILQEREENNKKIDLALSNSYESLEIAMEALNQLVWGHVE